MKYYIATIMNYFGDSITIYEGTDRDSAILAARSEWNHLTERDRDRCGIAIIEYDVPDYFRADSRYDRDMILAPIIEDGGNCFIDWRE